MADLLLHGRPIRTVFDLLGDRENDLTYALGWGLANSDRLVTALLEDVANELGVTDAGSEPTVRLQEHVAGSGYTDVEVRTSEMHVIVEAKRGWVLPGPAQLKKYALSLTPGLTGVLVIAAEGSPDFAAGKHPGTVPGPDGEPVPVLYRSWEQLTCLADGAGQGRGSERRLVRELARYLRGLISMQDQRDNMVYVVSLGTSAKWSPISPREIVLTHGKYFHPVGGGAGGWPKEPPNYLGFRFDGRLQLICHVDDVVVTTTFEGHVPGFSGEMDDPHYVYTLGAPITPAETIRSGKVTRALRVWAALDLLLTSKTISDARDRSAERLAAAGQ